MCFKIKSDENVVCLFFFVSQRLMIDGLSITKEYVNTLIWGLSFLLSGKRPGFSPSEERECFFFLSSLRWFQKSWLANTFKNQFFNNLEESDPYSYISFMRYAFTIIKVEAAL